MVGVIHRLTGRQGTTMKGSKMDIRIYAGKDQAVRELGGLRSIRQAAQSHLLGSMDAAVMLLGSGQVAGAFVSAATDSQKMAAARIKDGQVPQHGGNLFVTAASIEAYRAQQGAAA